MTLTHRKTAIANHFSNADEYQYHAHVQAKVCDLLIARVAHTQQAGVLEIGAGQGQFTQKLASTITANDWYLNELCQSNEALLRAIIPDATIQIGDAEHLNWLKLKQKFSLITSANTVQWFDNPLRFIQQSAELMQDNGQLLFNTFTPNNFYQIKQLTGQGLVYPSSKAWQAALKRHGFELKEMSIHRFEVVFDSPYEVLQHIKKTGVSVNVSNGTEDFRWTKSSLKQFYQDYQHHYSNADGQLVLTYEALLVDARHF